MNAAPDYSASMLVEDYIRPAAIRAGILIERDGKTYSKDGDLVKRFGFLEDPHNGPLRSAC